MAALVGNWEYVGAENLDGYMQAAGKIFILLTKNMYCIKRAGPQGFLGIWGEWLFFFRELGSTGNYFRGSREQAHIFGDLGSPAKKQKKKKKKKRKSLHFV